jgi:hypothetical protein
LFGGREGFAGKGIQDQFCLQCGDNEEDEDVNCKSEARRERKNFLQHDSARPYTSILTRKNNAEFKWTVVPHLPHSPKHVTSDLHLFGLMKEGLHGTHFADDDDDDDDNVAITKLTTTFTTGRCRLWFSGGENVYKALVNV